MRRVRSVSFGVPIWLAAGAGYDPFDDAEILQTERMGKAGQLWHLLLASFPACTCSSFRPSLTLLEPVFDGLKLGIILGETTTPFRTVKRLALMLGVRL